jgi:predicted Zn-dependent peptidase
VYRKLILENGVRLVTERIPTLKSVTVGIWVNAGSRDETPAQAGYSHFIEHMFFKGTTSRSATNISREIDALGGEMNAFTTRETTTFYVKVLDQHLAKALDLLSDLLHRSKFGLKEIEKEKQVVLEEIRMVQDDPEDLVQELHTGQVMGRHPLGRPILGRAATIGALRRQDLLDYIDARYQPQEIVVAVAGNFDQRALELPKPHERLAPEIRGGVVMQRKQLEQVHLCIGMKGLSAGHPDRYAAYILNSVLGGSVSSRLFQEVREKRGLAYSIYSFLSGYSDGGTLTVYAGTRQKEVERVLEVVRREIRRMAANSITRDELKRTKDQMKGSLMLSLESSHSRMNKLAKDELIKGKHTTLDEMTRAIDAVTFTQMERVAQDLLDEKSMAITGLGPLTARQLQLTR